MILSDREIFLAETAPEKHGPESRTYGSQRSHTEKRPRKSINSEKEELVSFFRSPRALAPGMALTLAAYLVAIIYMIEFPMTIQEFTLLGVTIDVPLTGAVPIFFSFVMVHYLFDSHYIIGKDYVRSVDGVLSFSENDVVIEMQDIRAIEVDYGLYGRFANTGSIKIGTAAHEAQEITMRFVYNPEYYRDIIVARRAQLEPGTMRSID
ncbi:MAG: hypothetical protein KDD55_03065 [Bdellovibrionales bacterium]|nr:hypothetical protein [Bdellovibrionales bacterium]